MSDQDRPERPSNRRRRRKDAPEAHVAGPEEPAVGAVVAEEPPVGPDTPEDPPRGPGWAPAGAVVERRSEGPSSRPVFVEVEERPDGPRWAPTELNPATGKPATVIEAESREAADHWDETIWGQGW